jgi:hypothetical protein
MGTCTRRLTQKRAARLVCQVSAWPLPNGARSIGAYHGLAPLALEKLPVAPLSGSKANRTISAAPCSTVWYPRCALRSVAVYPGSAEFTLIVVSLNS